MGTSLSVCSQVTVPNKKKLHTQFQTLDFAQKKKTMHLSMATQYLDNHTDGPDGCSAVLSENQSAALVSLTHRSAALFTVNNMSTVASFLQLKSWIHIESSTLVHAAEHYRKPKVRKLNVPT